MLALTVDPAKPGTLDVTEVPDPVPGDDLLVEGVAVGVCATDREITYGEHGVAPPGQSRLILGHESLGRVIEAPAGSGFAKGDFVAGVVRRPDPVPCGACARGEFDMCRNGEYTERGIKGAQGYASQMWTVEPSYAVKVPPRLADVGMLVEPASIVSKAWEQVERIGARAWFEPKRVLVTGAGPIGLLAALLGVQRGLEVHVLDQAMDGVKAEVTQALGAYYHVSRIADVPTADIIIEATGASQLVFEAIANTASYGIVCLVGVSPSGREIPVDVGAANRSMVLENDAIVGSVNANHRHFAAAVAALEQADLEWLRRLITRRVPLARFAEAFERHDGDIKTVIELGTEL